MKSAIGIGALLMDGLGDTIRVSLTEDPEYEIDPCTRLAGLGERAWSTVSGEQGLPDVGVQGGEVHGPRKRLAGLGKRAWSTASVGEERSMGRGRPCRELGERLTGLAGSTGLAERAWSTGRGS